MDPNLQKLLIESQDLDLDIQQNYVLSKNIISNVLQKTILVNDVHTIYIYNNDKMVLDLKATYTQGESIKDYVTINNSWYSDLGNVTITFSDSNMIFNRRIKSIYNTKNIGFASLVASNETIKEKLKLIKTNDSRYLIVTDEFNNIIVHNNQDDEKIKQIIENVNLENVNKSTIQKTGFLNYNLITIFQSELTNLKIISYIPVSEFMRSPSIITKWIISSSMIGIVIGSIFTYYNAKRLVRPINRLIFAVGQVENENFEIKIRESGYLEIATLSRDFNKMTFKINNLIEQVYKEEIKRKDAELKMLQMQINPHFFYNTLDTINWLAEFHKTTEIRIITNSIAKLMKESINNKKRFNTLEKEVEYIKSYLNIYMITLDNKFSYSIEISDDVKQKHIPKFLLQPIVENSINHGIKLKIGLCNINISSYMQNGNIIIEVFDDGVGMSKEKLDDLNSGKVNEEIKDITNTTGIGITNIKERIKIIYGEGSFLIIESDKSLGTLVKVQLEDISLDRLGESV